MSFPSTIARRTQKRLASAIRRANFRNQKTLEEFDFSFNPNINRSLIAELASCRFMEEKVGVLIVGPCGTGKSHIAQALGHCAIRAGYDVLFVTASRLLVQMNAARATNTPNDSLPNWPGSISSSLTTSASSH